MSSNTSVSSSLSEFTSEISIEDGDPMTTGNNRTSKGTSLSTTSLPSEGNNKQKKIWRQKYWPPRGWMVKWLTWFFVLAAVYGSLWSVFPEAMEPKHSMFSLVLTILLCIAAEQLVVKIPTPKGFPPLPPLLASLLMGLALRNIPVINIAVDIDENANSILRNVALTVILTRAGLEIEPEAIKQMKRAVVSLAFVPSLVETAVIGILGHYILDFPYTWAFMTGFMISAASSAVIVPSLIILQDTGFGLDKGIPSLVMAASSIEDILAIAGFTVFLGIIFPTETEDDVMDAIDKMLGFDTTESLNGTVTMAHNFLNINPTMVYPGNYTNTEINSTTTQLLNNTISQTQNNDSSTIGRSIVFALIQIIIGLVSGLVLGLFISYIPHRNMKYKNFCRGALLLLIAILFVFGSTVLGVSAVGPLCALTMTFTASLHWKEEVKPLAEVWHYMWVILQPILFGLTGALVDVTIIDATTVGLGLATLFVALIFRSIASGLVTFGLNYNLKEKLFVAISWLPKGTVQAAFGSVALEKAKKMNQLTEIQYGEQMLILAVLITLISAPIGGFGINLTGPRLLSRPSQQTPNSSDNEAYVGTEIESCHGSSGYNSESIRSSLDGSSSSSFELKSRDLFEAQQDIPSCDGNKITKL